MIYEDSGSGTCTSCHKCALKGCTSLSCKNDKCQCDGSPTKTQKVQKTHPCQCGCGLIFDRHNHPIDGYEPDEDEDEDEDEDAYFQEDANVSPWFAAGFTKKTVDHIAHKGCQDDMTRDAIAMSLDPVQAMADFYLSEYVFFLAEKACQYGASLANDASRVPYLFRQDAHTLQESVVQRADAIFQDYVFAAIGGEARYHESVQMNANDPLRSRSGRTGAWSAWVTMSEQVGRLQMAQWAEDIFGDGSWSPSYGGSKWADIARTLRQRLDGTLDAKTFVDRVFSLQHNGGSCLNKLSWPNLNDGDFYWDVGMCQQVGNAHAGYEYDEWNNLIESNGYVPNFTTLLQCASQDGRDLVATLEWRFRYNIPSDHHPAIVKGLESLKEHGLWEDGQGVRRYYREEAWS